jgi:putative MATE family efflux protein
LAASAFVVLAAEPLYLLVDTAVVGHLGTVALGALGVGVALLGFVVLVGTFVEYGTTGRAARFFGSGDHEAAVNEGVQASWLALVIGLGVVAVAEIFAHPLVALLAGSDAATRHAAESWFRIAAVGIPGVLLVLAGNGWMRGVQQTRQPVRIVLFANALSAAASPILVYPCHLGLNGSAYANVGAQLVGSVLFVRALSRATSRRQRPDWAVMRKQLVVGRDLILRSTGFQVAFLTAAGVASRMGSAQIGAHQIGLQLWEFTALLLDSFAIAAQSLVGAALGSSNVEAAMATAWRVARYGLWAGCLFGAIIAAGWQLLPAAFTSSSSVQHQAHLLWPWLAGMQPLGGVVFALDGVLIGAGDVGYLRTLTLVAGVAAFAPINLAALHWHWGIGGVWAGLTAFIVVRFVGMMWRTKGGRWAVVGT